MSNIKQIQLLQRELSEWLASNNLSEDTFFRAPEAASKESEVYLATGYDLSAVLWCQPTDKLTATQSSALRSEFNNILAKYRCRFEFQDESMAHLYVRQD